MSLSRRTFLHRTGLSGIGLLTFSVAGCQREMTPAQARRSDVAFEVLSTTQVAALERLGDAIVPGSAQDGLAHYIDHQLNAPADQCMLMIKYLGVPAPFTGFYQAGLAAAAKAAAELFPVPVEELDDVQSASLISQMSMGAIENWDAPPPAFFYFVLRSDAVDVSYGTKQGFARLGIPYAAHIDPPTSWGN